MRSRLLQSAHNVLKMRICVSTSPSVTVDIVINKIFFHGNFRLRDRFKSSINHLALSTIIPRKGCKTRSGSHLRPSHDTALV